MRLLSFTRAGRVSWGVLEGAGVIDLGARAALGTPTLTAALHEDGLMGIAMNAVGLPADHDLAQLALLPPVVNPGRFIRGDADDPSAVRHHSPRRLIAPGTTLASRGGIPLSWRPGLAAVVGSPCCRVAASHAIEMLAGYTCLAEWADGTVALGPQLTTPDEFLAPGQTLTARVNGQLVRSVPVAPLLNALRALVARVTLNTPLDPGDVVAVAGPPSPDWTPRPGDRCAVRLPAVGTLTISLVPRMP